MVDPSYRQSQSLSLIKGHDDDVVCFLARDYWSQLGRGIFETIIVFAGLQRRVPR